MVDEIGDDDPVEVNAQLVKDLHESYDSRADWHHRLLDQRIDQERATLEGAIDEIEGDQWQHWEA